MSNNLSARKKKLISFIESLEQEDVLMTLEAVVEKKKSHFISDATQNSVSEPQAGYFALPKNRSITLKEQLKIQKTIRKTVTVDELRKEQSWKNLDRDKLAAYVKELDIQEPIELLMSQLTK